MGLITISFILNIGMIAGIWISTYPTGLKLLLTGAILLKLAIFICSFALGEKINWHPWGKLLCLLVNVIVGIAAIFLNIWISFPFIIIGIAGVVILLFQ